MAAANDIAMRICSAICLLAIIGVVSYVEDAVATANMTLIESKAEKGDVNAQVQLGSIYDFGDEDGKHYKKAFGWFLKAAEQGNADGEYYVGDYYADGKGVAQDYAEAKKWYCKAEAQGNAAAQGGLGILYAHGLGVSRDYVQAYYWFSLAEKTGNLEYVKDRDDMAKHLNSKQIAAMRKYVREWKPGPAGADDSFGGCP